MLELILGYFLIFSARVIDVSCATLRMLLLVRGKRFLAAGIGFVEVTLYIVVLGYVVERLSDPFSIIVYGLGFATGNIVGSMLEERMALGFATVQIITLDNPMELAENLREAGFGVTIVEGQGREGIHPILHIILRRKRVKELLGIIDEWDKNAFVTVLETRSTLGGVGVAGVRRKAK
ncbi:MAG: DUF2179 domain-containing protein [Clostridia bacterium]|jgi:uncharacterized protein YebE (UPF0316 family)|nr:DUF2179 domain-containing protein [Clostridia bacterium]